MTVKDESGLLSICAADAPQFSSAVYNRGTQARKLQANAAQSGRSMIEMLGVLAIIGVLSVGGIAGYSKAMMQYKINKTVDQISLIAGNIRTLFMTQKNYAGLQLTDGSDNLNYALLKKAHVIPDEMWATDTSIVSAFGTDVSLGSEDKAVSGDNKAFYIYFMDLPEEACMELLTKDWSNANANIVFTGMQEENTKYRKPPVSVDIAAKMCPFALNDFDIHFDINPSSSIWKNRIE